VEGPKDEYYSSLNTLDHDSALGKYPQPEVLLVPRRASGLCHGIWRIEEPTVEVNA
jgi:hypothetical protein